MIFKIFKLILAIVILGYGILWLLSIKNYDTELGISYSPQYARYLGLDAMDTYDAILTDLNPQTVRIAAPWSDVEISDDKYDWSEVDQLVKKAEDNGTKIILTIGQKVPRWPECYIPDWVEKMSSEDRKTEIFEYIKEGVQRYKSNPAIEYWQAENEPFLRFPFGDCEFFERSLVRDEVKYIKSLDPSRKVVVTDSGELSTFRRPSWYGDILGTTLYRTVRIGNGSVMRYDWVPPSYYKIKARFWGNKEEQFFISELQAEPWYKEGIPTDIKGFSDEETFSTKRFVDNLSYAKRTGASRVYFWGAEWWYFMKEKVGDESYWNTAKAIFEEGK